MTFQPISPGVGWEIMRFARDQQMVPIVGDYFAKALTGRFSNLDIEVYQFDNDIVIRGETDHATMRTVIPGGAIYLIYPKAEQLYWLLARISQ